MCTGNRRCFWEGGLGPLPYYWHFVSTTCPRCLQSADRVYLLQTLTTDHRPPSACAEVKVVIEPCFFFRKGARAALEGEAGYREISRAAAAAVTGGWRAGAVAVLAVAKRLEELGGRQKRLGRNRQSSRKGGGGTTPSSAGLKGAPLAYYWHICALRLLLVAGKIFF